MENLNLKNFWNPQKIETPDAVQLFCDWIDVYKKDNDWENIFNGGLTFTASPTNGFGRFESGIRATHAPKFHNLPLEMQLGILQRFAKLNDTGNKNILTLFRIQDSLDKQKEYAALYFKLLQEYLIEKAG